MRVDAQVDPLIEKVRARAEELIRLLALLPFAEGAEKDRLIRSISAVLRVVEQDVREWAEIALQEVADEHDEFLLPFLSVAGVAAIADQLVENTARELNAVVSTTVRSIQGYAQTLANPSSAATAVNKALNRRSRLQLHALEGAEKASIAAQLEGALNQHFVRILGRDGRIYTYALDYWMAMQAQMSRGLLRRQLTLARAIEAGMDLVQISNNPSTIGDFCDLYRGKVFSISGEHPYYPPLAYCPNGGTPFHPWCRHVMFPVILDDNLEDFAGIPQKYLDLGKDPKTSVNDFQKLWIGDNDE